MKVSRILYSIARGVGKLASTVNDLETVSTMNPGKIGKRLARKTINKAGSSLIRSISRRIK